MLYDLYPAAASSAEQLPSPIYEVAIGGPQEIPSESGYEYTFGKLMYAPKYPYYSFPDENDDEVHPPPAQDMQPPVYERHSPLL